LDSLPAEVRVVVSSSNNEPPIADAGPNRSLLIGSLLLLDGSGFDPDGDDLSFRWQLLSAPPGSEAQPPTRTSEASAEFIPDRLGVYRFGLIANDGQVDSPIDAVEVVVDPLTDRPEVKLTFSAERYDAFERSGYFLDARGSIAAGEDEDAYRRLDFEWTLISPEAPRRLNVLTGGATAFVQTELNADPMIVQVIAIDGDARSEPFLLELPAGSIAAPSVASAMLETGPNGEPPAVDDQDGFENPIEVPVSVPLSLRAHRRQSRFR